MVRSDRIRYWGLDDAVKDLLREGLSPREVARRINLDPRNWSILGEAKVYARDVEEYLMSEEDWSEEKEANMLAHTTQGQQAIVEVHESVQWLTTFVNGHLMPFAKTTMLDVQDVRDRWRLAFEKDAEGEPPGYPLREIKAMEGVVRLVKDLVDSVRNDPKIQSIVKAGNLNVQHGITEEGMWERLNGVARHLECPNCGHEGFTRSDVGSAYARWRSASRVVDADKA